ncbi:ParB/RepB/Spo0J family partition protein [Yoonia sp. SS1-5]|uniref:ParB/RepB/Spo0J family partition protein n=1 Tax=Yoonia rhodophyticola TaxID=3137370 RepID=A0AAN0MBS5_9RHOB
MTKQQKITLSASRDIPFNKLLLSQSNVRHIKAGVSIEELAEDIARRTLLASLTVRPVLDETGTETGMFEIPAGGRRYRALELLVKQKRLNRTAPVPCIIRTDGLAEEDSLAENIQRAPLHPLDQFRAFQAMREKGKSEEEIAAAFFVSASIVKQRLKLAAVAPSLLDAYAEEEMTLDQLMAFTVNPDHERQEQVWESLQRHYSKQPYEIRRMLTEGAVRASDRRAQYVGLDPYVDAGGAILRDLFQTDDGGWLQDAGLLDLMVAEKLREDAATVQAEGWHWVEVDTDFPYGHTYGMRRMAGEVEPMTDEEAATYDALKTEFEKLEADHADAEELPDEVDARLGEIETAMETLQDRPVRFEEEALAIAGAFVSIDSSGRLRVERGYVRPEDEPALPSDDQSDGDTADADVDDTDIDPETGAPHDEENEDDGIKPLSDRLVTELTAHRTLALRDALAGDPNIAFVAALHVLTLKLFYRYGVNSCIEIDPRSAAFSAQAPGLADTPSAQAIEARSENWAKHLPKAPEDLWDVLIDFDSDTRQALFAHCVSLTLNAAHEAYNRRPGALAHADILATALRLDMAAVGWTPTAEAYLSRVTKAQILEAVREAKGDDAADRIAGLKKPEMVTAAEELLNGTGWLPEPLRTQSDSATAPEADQPAAAKTGTHGPIDAADMPDAKDAPQVDSVAAE